MWKAFGLFASVMLGLMLALADAGGQTTAKPVIIRYALPLPIAEYLPLYAGREKGYFRQENLAVDVLTLPTGDKLTLALIGGSVDISSYTPDWFIRAVEKGDAKIKLVMGGSNVPVYSLVVRGEIKSYSDLKGKRIAVSTVKASDAYLVRKMLAANGLRDADYILIQAGAGGERAAALKAGSVSATLMIPPFDQRLVDEGYRRLDVTSNVITQYNWLSHAVREDWARANRTTLVAFMRGWIKATRWVYDPRNKEEAIRLLTRELKLEDRYARKVYEMYYESTTATVAKDGAMDMVGLQALINAMAEQGDLTPPTPKAEKYLDLSYWQEALKTLQ